MKMGGSGGATVAREVSSGGGLWRVVRGKVCCDWAICGCDGYKEGCGSEGFDVDLLECVVVSSGGVVAAVEAKGGGGVLQGGFG